MEHAEMSLVADDMILFKDQSKEVTEKLLELIN